MFRNMIREQCLVTLYFQTEKKERGERVINKYRCFKGGNIIKEKGKRIKKNKVNSLNTHLPNSLIRKQKH